MGLGSVDDGSRSCTNTLGRIPTPRRVRSSSVGRQVEEETVEFGSPESKR